MAYSENTDWDREKLRRRTAGIVIALALEALLLIAILSLSFQSSETKPGGRSISSFDLTADFQTASADRSKSDPAAQKTDEQKRNPAPFIPKPLLPPANKINAPPPSPDFIEVSKAEYDAMDLAKIPSSDGSGAGDKTGAGQGKKGLMGPGEGPGGQPLYPVAWYREPTDPEMAPYLQQARKAPPGAWAEIACRMIENYRVENCQILGESPRGTGLAKAIRRASWQFLVRPPRIGDKAQLGVWVRIRFTFQQPPEQTQPTQE